MSRYHEERSALEADRNDYGVAESFHTTGAIDFTNPMFQQLGTNPRTLRDLPRARPGVDDDGEKASKAVQGERRPGPAVQPGRRGQPPRRRHLDQGSRAGRRSTTTVDLAVTRFTRNIPPRRVSSP